jgi:membrane protein implicated in regulation of membrane protease activity
MNRHAPGRKGTHENPRSALNLRLVLATFGLVSCTALAVVTFWVGILALGVALVVLAVVAAVDLVVVGRRVIRRRRRGERHTLFE